MKRSVSLIAASLVGHMVGIRHVWKLSGDCRMKRLVLAAALFVGMAMPAWADALEDYLNCGVASTLSEYDIVIRLCSRAIESGELWRAGLPGAYSLRGEAYKHKDLYDRAIKDQRKALQLNPDLEAAKKALRELGFKT